MWSFLGDPDAWASSLLGLGCLSTPLPPLLCAWLSPPFSGPPLRPSRHLPQYTSCVNSPVLISISQRTQTNTRSLLLEGVGLPVLQNSPRAGRVPSHLHTKCLHPSPQKRSFLKFPQLFVSSTGICSLWFYILLLCVLPDLAHSMILMLNNTKNTSSFLYILIPYL